MTSVTATNSKPTSVPTTTTSTKPVAQIVPTNKPPLPFKKQKSLELRKSESNRILEKYPDRIPIIAERALANDTIPIIDKIKYLAPADLTIGQFQFVLRKRMSLKPEQALFVFCGNKNNTTSSEVLSSIYKKAKDEDGFLYVKYSGESTFGMQQ